MIPHGHALAALNLGSVMNRKVSGMLHPGVLLLPGHEPVIMDICDQGAKARQRIMKP
jgi:hypothetical protein